MNNSRLSRRVFLGRALAMGTVLVGAKISGCAPKTPVTQPAVPEGPAETIPAPIKAEERIRISVQVAGGLLGVHLYEIGKTFMEHHPNIELNLQEVPYSEIGVKTELGAAVGDLQDVLHAFSRWHWLGCYKGWYLALDDLIESTDAVGDMDDFYEVGVVNQLWEGKHYGLLEAVYAGAATMIIWNRQMIEEAGAQIPTADMDMWDLHELARKCTDESKGNFGIQMDMGTPGRITGIVRAWGKPDYGPEGDTSSWLTSADRKQYNLIDNSGAQAFFKDWLHPLINTRAHPKPEDAITGGLFVAGKLAIATGYQAHALRFKKSIGDQWDFHTQDATYLPKGPDGRLGSCQESHMKAVYAKTKHPEEAFRFAAYATSYEAGVMGIKESGAFSGRKSVYRDPQFHDEFPIYKEFDAIMTEGIVEPYSIPWNLRDIEYSDLWTQLGADLRDGTKSWSEQAPYVQSEIQKLFDLPRP